MSLTSKSIRFALKITDPNIIFTKDAEIKPIQGVTSQVYYAKSFQNAVLSVVLVTELSAMDLIRNISSFQVLAIDQLI